MTTSVKPNSVYSNPVVRTYIQGPQVHGLCFVLLIGLVMTVVGPLSGILVRQDKKDSATSSREIKESTICFAQKLEPQDCAEFEIAITFFNVQNSEDVEAGISEPVLEVIGPYTLKANEVHGSVTYGDDEVEFEESSLKLRKDCDSCDWSRAISILTADGLKTGKPHELASHLLGGGPVGVVLNTGAKNAKESFSTIRFGSTEVAAGPKYNGRFFGDSFKDNPAIFESELRHTVGLVKDSTKSSHRGIDATVLVLDIDEDCENCSEFEWQKKEGKVVYSLPFQHEGFNNEGDLFFDYSIHRWRFLVDDRYGFTLFSRRSYQANHLIESYTVDPYWAASHWISIESIASNNIISKLRNEKKWKTLSFYICDVGVSALGALMVIAAFIFMRCTPTARDRLATQEYLARSRARDWRLNQSQFKFLKKFLKRMAERKEVKTKKKKKRFDHKTIPKNQSPV